MPRALRLLLLLPDGSQKELAPSRWPVTLGRAADNTISVPADTTLSQHHLKIDVTSEHRVFVLDLASTNGTRVNGKNIGTLPYDLKDGDEIRAGRTRLKVLFLGTGSAAGERRSPGISQRLKEAATGLLRGVLGQEKLPPGYARCPHCGAKIHVGGHAGRKVGCPRCRKFFTPGGKA